MVRLAPQLGDNAKALSRNKAALHDDAASCYGLQEAVNAVKDDPPPAESTHMNREAEICIEHPAPVLREQERILHQSARR